MTSHTTCASCEGVLGMFRVARPDGTYCCLGCTAGGPCICTYDDMDVDGVDNLGLPFRLPEPESPWDDGMFDPDRDVVREPAVLVG
jgi:hypothetical protein